MENECKMSDCRNNQDIKKCCKKQNELEEQVKSVQDYIVCTCMEVTYLQIMQEIKNGADNFKKLSKSLGVGTGCSSCVEEIEEILIQNLEKNKKV